MDAHGRQERCSARTVTWLPLLLTAVLVSGCTGDGSGDEASADGVSGKVSEAEYRVAKETELRCIQDTGLDAKLEPSHDGVTLNITVNHPALMSVEARESAMAEAQEAVDRCATEHSAIIEAAFIQQQKLTGTEKEEALDSLHQCFLSIPVDGALRSDSSRELLRRASTQYPNPSDPKFTAALSCLESHKWAITDQNDPE